MKAERKLGRVPEEQHHTNPGYDVLSTDPATGVCYFIEVKGHLPQTDLTQFRLRPCYELQRCRWLVGLELGVNDPVEASPHQRERRPWGSRQSRRAQRARMRYLVPLVVEPAQRLVHG